MARPKLISDSELLDRAFKVISNEGFESFTFKQVGRACGLSPAALVKRFGTKRRLAMLARNQKWDRNLSGMENARLDSLRGLSGIFEFLRVIAASVDSKRLGEHARWLGAEASDVRTRKKVAGYFAETRGIFKRLIEEAIQDGDISSRQDPEEFAWLMEALVQGAIFQFAFLDRRSVREHLEKQFRVLLTGNRGNFPKVAAE